MKIVNPSVHLVDFMGSDLSVVNAARVSFAKESDFSYIWDSDDQICIPCLQDKDTKLINYLAKHNHWSPFAHNSLTFRIKAPVFVARQMVKHQVGGVWNEVSRRYVDDEPEFYFPKRDGWRGRAENVKQGSSKQTVDVFQYGNDYCENIPEDAVEVCLEAYERLLHRGVAPEQARMILPQNTMTEWWWTGSLMFFARVCKQRLDPHAQEETRNIAQMINDNIPQEFQHSWKALMT